MPSSSSFPLSCGVLSAQSRPFYRPGVYSPSLSLGAVRLAISSLALVTIVLLRGGFRLTAAWSWKLAFLAAAGVAISQLAFLSGIRLTGVVVETMVSMGSAPIFSALFDAFLQKREVQPQLVPGHPALGERYPPAWRWGARMKVKINPLGILLTLLSGFSYTVMTLANKRLLGSLPTPHRAGGRFFHRRAADFPAVLHR